MKGMNKILRGWSFKSILNYCEARGSKDAPDGRLIGGNMVGGSVHELLKEFIYFRKQNPDIEKATWHNSLRLPPGDALEDHQWNEIVAEYMRRMGFKENHPYCIWKHDDESAVHIIACRVGLNSNVYLGKNENLISTKIIQQLEIEFKLTRTKGPQYDESGKLVRKQVATLSKKELDQAFRTGGEPVKQKLQKLIDEAIGDAANVIDFIERLSLVGVEVRPNVAKTGAMSGFSFSLDNVAFKGSQLGKNFTWKRLQERGVTYEQDRDRERLQRFCTSTLNAPGGGGIPAVGSYGDPEVGRVDRPVAQDRIADPTCSGDACGDHGDVPRSSDGRRIDERADVGGEKSAVERDPIDQTGSSEHERGDTARQGAYGRSGRFNSKVVHFSESTVRDSHEGPDRFTKGDDQGRRADGSTSPSVGVSGQGSVGFASRQVDGRARIVGRETEKLIRLWREQHQAIDALAYRIHLEPSRSDLEAVTWNDDVAMTAAQVEASLMKLRRVGARGYKVTVSPVHSTTRYFILQVGEAALERAGLAPALVMSDREHTQAVIKVRQEDGEKPGAESDRLLVQQLQAEVDDSSETRRLWLAGFPTFGLQGAVARIVSATGAFCKKTVEFLESIRRGLRALRESERVRADTMDEEQRRIARRAKAQKVTEAGDVPPPPSTKRLHELPQASDPPQDDSTPLDVEDKTDGLSSQGTRHRPGH